jgi:hypothetical protein
VVELADALDSKSSGSNTMRVRFPPSAPYMKLNHVLHKRDRKGPFFYNGEIPSRFKVKAYIKSLQDVSTEGVEGKTATKFLCMCY